MDHEPLISEETSNCKCQANKPCPNKPLFIMQVLMFIVLLVILGMATYLLINTDSSNNIDKNRRIRIGMAGMRLNETNTGDFNVSLYNYANLKYLDAIQKAGGTPMVLPVLTNLSIDLVEEQLDTIDALIIPGGYDVVPSLYGEETTKWIERTSYITDIYLIQLIKSAYARKMPILGICRGLQIINVAFGGTLFQDLSLTPQQLPSRKHYQTIDGCLPTHNITINSGSILSEIFPGKTVMDVNSFHHQCIDRLANGFAIDAMSPDGIIESIHKKEGSFVFGTQFHPEMFVVCSDSFLPIFSRLVSEGKKYLSSK